MREDLRYCRDSEAPGIAVEERRRTPSMSKAKAKFGILWFAGCEERYRVPMHSWDRASRSLLRARVGDRRAMRAESGTDSRSFTKCQCSKAYCWTAVVLNLVHLR